MPAPYITLPEEGKMQLRLAGDAVHRRNRPDVSDHIPKVLVAHVGEVLRGHNEDRSTIRLNSVAKDTHEVCIGELTAQPAFACRQVRGIRSTHGPAVKPIGLPAQIFHVAFHAENGSKVLTALNGGGIRGHGHSFGLQIIFPAEFNTCLDK